jgi:hypothetical protein
VRTWKKTSTLGEPLNSQQSLQTLWQQMSAGAIARVLPEGFFVVT